MYPARALWAPIYTTIAVPIAVITSTILPKPLLTLVASRVASRLSPVSSAKRFFSCSSRAKACTTSFEVTVSWTSDATSLSFSLFLRVSRATLPEKYRDMRYKGRGGKLPVKQEHGNPDAYKG